MSEPIDRAVQFINTTQNHIFLTGKAGTGKTTFLKNLSKVTYKSFIIVAPTGIAALNAGGVTIHSQFSLPPVTFLVDKNFDGDFNTNNVINQKTLAIKHPLSSHRKKIFQNIDLLVIDEVSMLRADVVDAIDYRLKSARRNFKKSFGGVQVLFIGDLHQLSPIIKREEEKIFYANYKSLWFYDAKVLQIDQPVYLELDKIFRQQDDRFISILNHLRHNKLLSNDLEILNSYYQSDQAIDKLKEIITLTTHNAKADAINSKQLNDLLGKINYYVTTTTGEYPENMYPVSYQIELKVGARIMFIRNDLESNLYYNGKLATVVNLSLDDITVIMDTTDKKYVLKKIKWENKKYVLNPNTQFIDEEVIGSFEQYPIKLAWAITIHKSQGLTFEKAIIDVGQSFATGQVYVALSRLRSLDGLILRSKILPSVISTDQEIVDFEKKKNQPEKLDETIRNGQILFVEQIFNYTFEFSELISEIVRAKDEKPQIFLQFSIPPILDKIAGLLCNEKENTHKFRSRLGALLKSNEITFFLDFLSKGSAYYTKVLVEQIEALLFHMALMKQQKRVKSYMNCLIEIDLLLTKKWCDVGKIVCISKEILAGQQNCDFKKMKQQQILDKERLIKKVEAVGATLQFSVNTNRKSKSISKHEDKESTYEKTLKLIKQGMDVKAIALARELAVSTIDTHLVKLYIDGLIEISLFVNPESLNEISQLMKDNPDMTWTEVFFRFNRKYSYGILRSVDHFLKINTKEQ